MLRSQGIPSGELERELRELRATAGLLLQGSQPPAGADAPPVGGGAGRGSGGGDGGGDDGSDEKLELRLASGGLVEECGLRTTFGGVDAATRLSDAPPRGSADHADAPPRAGDSRGDPSQLINVCCLPRSSGTDRYHIAVLCLFRLLTATTLLCCACLKISGTDGTDGHRHSQLPNCCAVLP